MLIGKVCYAMARLSHGVALLMLCVGVVVHGMGGMPGMLAPLRCISNINNCSRCIKMISMIPDQLQRT